MSLTKARMPFIQAQFARRIESATHIRPIFMPRDEFETLLRHKVLDVAKGDILSDADDIMAIGGLGQTGALELLMKIGLVLSELDIPSTRQNDEWDNQKDHNEAKNQQE